MQVTAAATPLLVTTSWDDGHPLDLRVADLLEKHGLSGTFYIPCTNSEGRPVMRAAEIGELGRQFEIGGHTRDHVILTGLAPRLAADQILTNKQWLEDLLSQEICGFAYVRGLHDGNVRNMVDGAGYRYARTAKTLMSTPGYDRLRIPTTTQFFPHSNSVRIRNFVRKGPTLQRAAVLAALLSEGGLSTRCARAAGACLHFGGHFHLWGHSWEIDKRDLWSELDCLFRRLRELNAHFVTNATWCASLTKSGEGPVQAAMNELEKRGPLPPVTRPDAGLHGRVAYHGA
jgi:hypothetical protein